VPDVVRDGETGLLAAVIEPVALANCARALLSDPQRRLVMGHAAARFIARERSLAQAADTLRLALASVIDARAAAGRQAVCP